MLPAKLNKTELKSKSAFARALERLKERRRVTRLGFLIDATGSREDTWEKAQGIQATMFRAASGLGPLSLRLMHFGGGHLTDHGWMNRARDVAAAMAPVRCVRGLTQFLPGLRAFLDQAPEERAAAIILIGDFFEEEPQDAEVVALALRQAGIRVFCFLEGADPAAEGVFRRLAEITGGRFARFGDSLPLGALCEGVALLAGGGESAVKRLENKQVQRLLLTGPSRK